MFLVDRTDHPGVDPCGNLPEGAEKRSWKNATGALISWQKVASVFVFGRWKYCMFFVFLMTELLENIYFVSQVHSKRTFLSHSGQNTPAGMSAMC